MFYSRVLEEIKGILMSISFYMMMVLLIIMYFTQFCPPNSYNPLAPIPNDKDQETNWRLSDEESEQACTYQRMLYDLRYGVTAKYQWGSVKWIKLTEAQKKELEKVKEKLAVPNSNYQLFAKNLEELNRALGGSTVYGITNRSHILGDTYYGSKVSNEEGFKIKMGYIEIGHMLAMNQRERLVGTFSIYTKLTNSEKVLLEEVMKRISPKGFDEKGELIHPITYKEYEKLLDELNHKMKGSYYFSKKGRENYLYKQPKTYAEASKEFKDIVAEDKVTSAYGRVFADYMGITAGFYPVFIVLSVFIRSRKKKAIGCENERIDTLAKYTAVCLCSLLPYVVLASHTSYVFLNIGKNYHYPIDALGFYKYTLAWIGPTLLFITALSMLIYKMSRKIIVTIGTIFAFWGIAVSTLGGDYRLFRYMIRFNELCSYNKYLEWQKSIVINRVFFVILSLIILSITLLIKKDKMLSHQINEIE